mmetsp:Transcript_5920/g.23451  ORF Transcript_5920/g.23451 Transcript_5920/m.23451 type:complete len:333 (+) Transcript_5920:33-1031(+)
MCMRARGRPSQARSAHARLCCAATDEPRSEPGPGQRGAVGRAALDDGGVGGAAALADGEQAVAAVALLELVDERGHELGAGRAERVAERHGRAANVQLVLVGAQRLCPGARHRREGLVDLVQVHVGQGEPRFREHILGRRDGTLEHHDGVRAGQREPDDARARLGALALLAQVLQAALVDDHDGRRAVGDLRGGTRREHAARRHGFELGEFLDCRSRAQTLVLGVQVRAPVLVLDLDGHDLVVEGAPGVRLGAALVRACGHRIQLGAAEVVLLGKHLGARELRELFARVVRLDALGVEREAVAGGHAHHHVGADGARAHVFHAASDDDVLRA